MATTGGAAVMSMDRLGVLEEGAPADLLLVDQTLDGLAGAQELEPSLALSESGRSVRHVIVDGRLVVENGHCLTVDEPAVRAALRDQVVKRKQGVANPPESTRSAMSVMRSFNKSLRESATTLPTQVGGDRSAQK